MPYDNFLKKRIEAVNNASKPTLDAAVKRFLALKPILARILKGCLKEYADLPIADIENKYIEGNPIVASEAVHEDESAPVITGTNIGCRRNAFTVIIEL